LYSAPVISIKAVRSVLVLIGRPPHCWGAETTLRHTI